MQCLTVVKGHRRRRSVMDDCNLETIDYNRHLWTLTILVHFFRERYWVHVVRKSSIKILTYVSGVVATCSQLPDIVTSSQKG
jgi:hypothetical protein